MPFRKTVFVLLLLAVSGFSVADADEKELSPRVLQKLHAKIDADVNGKVSLDELMTFFQDTRKSSIAKDLKYMIAELDSDKDGKISLNEVRQSDGADGDDESKKAWEERKFKAADGNGDGLLDESEVGGFYVAEGNDKVLELSAQQTLDEKDSDKDGFLSFDELNANIPKEDQRPEEFELVDKDGNGKIDLKELLVWESGQFYAHANIEKFMRLADTNGDQHVTVEELHAAHEKGGNPAEIYFEEMAEHHEL